MKFEIEKGLGLQTANYIRQLLLTQVPTWRPIAFSVGANSNVVFAGENVLEDSVEISTNICKYHYNIEEESDYFTISVSSNEIKINDLENKSTITIMDKDNDSILHTIDQAATLTIYFRKAIGAKSYNENQLFLCSHGIEANGVIIMNSRHCNYENIRTKVIPISELLEEVEINIVHSFPELDEVKIIRDCCASAINLFQNIVKTV